MKPDRPIAQDTELAMENLARMVRVIRRDPDLRQWFAGLACRPADERRESIQAMRRQMTEMGKDGDLVLAFGLLADERVFEAARAALEELE